MNKIVRQVTFLAGGLLGQLPNSLSMHFPGPGQIHGKLISAGQTRQYLGYVPKSYNPTTPVPLVISLHGFMEWPAHQMEISRWNDLADQEGFIVVYPAGTGMPMHWNSSTGQPTQVEVQFISDLIDHLAKQYVIDATRIYANGLSNGGGMSFLLACQLSDRIAAIGGVSGAYLTPWDACTLSRPIPAIFFHGTADKIVPYSGGPSNSFHIPFPNIPEWVQTYAVRNGCEAVPKALPQTAEVTGLQYSGLQPNARVAFYTIQGGGHAWPGGVPIPKFIVGHTTQDIDATRVMWDFFRQYQLAS